MLDEDDLYIMINFDSGCHEFAEFREGGYSEYSVLTPHFAFLVINKKKGVWLYDYSKNPFTVGLMKAQKKEKI